MVEQRFPLAPSGEGEYLLTLLGAATMVGSPELEVTLGSNEVTADFGYFAYPPKLFERFPVGDASVLAWPLRAMVVACQAGFVAGAPRVDFETWNGQSGSRWKLTLEGSKEEALSKPPWKSGGPGTRLVIRFRTGLNRSIFRVGGKSEFTDQIALLAEKASHAGTRVVVDGEAVNRPYTLGQGVLGLTILPPETISPQIAIPEVEVEAETQRTLNGSEAYWGSLLLNDEDSICQVICRGIGYPIEIPLLEELGLSAILVCNTLTSAPDCSKLIEDSSFEEFLHAVESDVLRSSSTLVELLSELPEESVDRVLEVLRSMVESHRSAGENDEAIELLAALSSVEALPDDAIAEFLTHRARLLEITGEAEESFAVYEEALEVWERLEPEDRDPEAFCTALLGAGFILSVSGMEIEKAISYAMTALELKREEEAGDDDPQLGLAAELLGWLYLHYTTYPEPEFLQVEPLLMEALRCHEATYGGTHAEVANVLQNLGEFYRLRSSFEDAERYFLKALAIREKLVGSRHESVGQLFDLLGNVFETAGDISKAGHYYGRALEIWEQLLGPDHEEVHRRLNDLVVLFRVYGHFDKAEPLYVKLLKLDRDQESLPSLELVPNFCSLALFYQVQSKYGQAENLFEKTLGALEKHYGAEANHPALAWVHGLCGRFFDDQYRFKKAEMHLQKALTMSEALLGEEHPDLIVCLEAMARHYRVQKNYADAMLYAERALSISERFYGARHPYVATSLNTFAELLYRSGEEEAALPIYLAAYEIHQGASEVLFHQEPVPNAEISRLAVVRREAEDFHRQAIEPAKEYSRFPEAESFFLRALFLREQTLGPDHYDNARTLQLLAHLYRNHRRYEGAESLYRRSLTLRQAHFGPDHPDCGISYRDLTEVLLLQGKNSEAEPLLKEWLTLVERTLGKGHVERAEILMRLTVILEERGDLEELIERLQEALTIRHTVFGTEHPTFAVTLAEMLRIEKKYGQAAELYDFVVTSLEKNLGEEDPLLIPILEKYAAVLDSSGRGEDAVEYETRALVMRAEHGLDFG